MSERRFITWSRDFDPANFCQTLAANVDNEKLTDAEFREFVRVSLPAPQPVKKET